MKSAIDTDHYEPLMNQGSSEDVLEHSYHRSRIQRPSNRRRGLWITISNVVLFVASLLILWLSSPLSAQKRSNWALHESSHYSPLFDRFDVSFVDKVVQSSLFNEDNILLRSTPSPQVDAAWEALADVGVIVITAEEVIRLGKDPNKTVRAPVEWGFGDNAHLAQIDGQHALHCLNAVRRYSYREHYGSHAHSHKRSESPTLGLLDEAHLSHCLHILLQALTCNPSYDLITHNWMDTQVYPFPDFALNKKCKDHSQLLAWQEKNRISPEQWTEMATRGPGTEDTIVQMPKLFKEWSEAADAKHGNQS